MFFSVVLPLYNKEKYINKAIQSILNQTFQNFEIIVVDDGSTDGSPRLVNSFNDNRITLISQANLGVSTARNEGVKKAKYEHIAFLDADDWWHPAFLEQMHQLISQYPESALYGSSYYYVKHGRETIANIGLASHYAGYINYFQIYANTFWAPINCSFVVVQKKAFVKVGRFKPSLKFGEDFDLWVRLALAYPVAYLNRPLAYSNQDVPAAERALGIGKNWSIPAHVLFHLGYLEKHENDNPSLKKLLDGLRVRGLIDFYLRGMHKKEVSMILQKIDFRQQDYFYYFVYRWPKGFVQLYFQAMRFGSWIKQQLL